MSSTIDVLAMIRKLFPGREDLLEHVYWSDSSFRMVCRDYRACHVTLERLRRQESPDASRKQSEYAGLIEELAAEIRDWPVEPRPQDAPHRGSAGPRRPERKDRP
jgi:hypothetical protein